MGSGVLLAALVVLWFVVLVPMVVTRGDAQGTRAELADSGRTLKRRRTVDPAVHADTQRVSIDRDALYASGELQVDVHALRRRTLGGLAALAVLALVGAVIYSPWLWTAQALLDLAVVGYLLVLRKAARPASAPFWGRPRPPRGGRRPARRAPRAAAGAAMRTPAARPTPEAEV